MPTLKSDPETLNPRRPEIPYRTRVDPLQFPYIDPFLLHWKADPRPLNP